MYSLKIINTDRLTLIQCNELILEQAILGNYELENLLQLDVDPLYNSFGKEPLQYVYDLVKKDPSIAKWATYLPIHFRDRKLIGFGGYKGKPNKKGIVEIGYEIAPAYRNKGFATEMAMALIYRAFKLKSVTKVIAHTLAKENPSTKVLLKCGFSKKEEIYDTEDGNIWRWELEK